MVVWWVVKGPVHWVTSVRVELMSLLILLMMLSRLIRLLLMLLLGMMIILLGSFRVVMTLSFQGRCNLNRFMLFEEDIIHLWIVKVSLHILILESILKNDEWLWHRSSVVKLIFDPSSLLIDHRLILHEWEGYFLKILEQRLVHIFDLKRFHPYWKRAWACLVLRPGWIRIRGSFVEHTSSLRVLGSPSGKESLHHVVLRFHIVVLHHHLELAIHHLLELFELLVLVWVFIFRFNIFLLGRRFLGSLNCRGFLWDLLRVIVFKDVWKFHLRR